MSYSDFGLHMVAIGTALRWISQGTIAGIEFPNRLVVVANCCYATLCVQLYFF